MWVRTVILLIIVVLFIGHKDTILSVVGSRDEKIGTYSVHIPLGWSFITSDAQGNAVPKSSPELRKFCMSMNFFSFSSCCMRVMKAGDLTTKQNSLDENPFTNLANRISKLTYTKPMRVIIDNIPFEKIYWSGNVGINEIKGFKYISIIDKDENIIRFEGCGGIGGDSEFAQAESIALSLKHQK